MAEPIVEQIAQWINDELDGKQDPEATMTLRAVRPKVLDWTIQDFKHGDVIIEGGDERGYKSTQKETLGYSRTELAIFKCYGVIRTIPANTAADTIINRMIETIRRILLAGLSSGQACNGIAKKINCPSDSIETMTGAVAGIVDVHVIYCTDYYDGYEQK